MAFYTFLKKIFAAPSTFQNRPDIKKISCGEMIIASIIFSLFAKWIYFSNIDNLPNHLLFGKDMAFQTAEPKFTCLRSC